MFDGLFGTSGELYHIGMRAAHLESALEELAETHQVEWTEVSERDFTVWEPGTGYRTYPLRLAFSRRGPIRLEVLESLPGSHWDGREVPGPHHLGVWVDDVAAEIERLTARGWTLEFAANSPEEGYGRFAYIRSPQGILFEPVDVTNRPRFEAWWAGGELASHRG